MWLLAWRAAVRRRQAQLQEELSEARIDKESLEEALQAARSARSGGELKRLALVDELQQAASQVAALTVQRDEAIRVGDSLKEAAAAQRAAAAELRTELSSLSAEQEELEEQRRKRCAALEAHVQQALEVPARLRAELRESQERAEAVAAEEAKTRHTTALLQAQLEELHRVAPERLQARSAEVGALHSSVEEARHMAHELEETLSQRRYELQARELGLEQQRRKDATLELGMFPDA